MTARRICSARMGLLRPVPAPTGPSGAMSDGCAFSSWRNLSDEIQIKHTSTPWWERTHAPSHNRCVPSLRQLLVLSM